MRLKHYQEKVIKALKDYLGELDIARNEYEEMLAIKPNLAKHINFPKDAWEKYWGVSSPSGRLGGAYHSQTNGLNEPLPDIYLKVPTGGGKTL
jgi:type III restriction enzyme